MKPASEGIERRGWFQIHLIFSWLSVEDNRIDLKYLFLETQDPQCFTSGKFIVLPEPQFSFLCRSRNEPTRAHRLKCLWDPGG